VPRCDRFSNRDLRTLANQWKPTMSNRSIELIMYTIRRAGGRMGLSIADIQICEHANTVRQDRRVILRSRCRMQTYDLRVAPARPPSRTSSQFAPTKSAFDIVNPRLSVTSLSDLSVIANRSARQNDQENQKYVSSTPSIYTSFAPPKINCATRQSALCASKGHMLTTSCRGRNHR
jgi:hypothetical protein